MYQTGFISANILLKGFSIDLFKKGIFNKTLVKYKSIILIQLIHNNRKQKITYHQTLLLNPQLNQKLIIY